MLYAELFNLDIDLFQHDSVFDLRRPYDMVAMLRQETRAASLDTLKQVSVAVASLI